MKKLLLTLIFAATCGFLYSQEFYSYGEFSYYPKLEQLGSPNNNKPYFGTTIGVGFEWSILFVEASQQVYMEKNDGVSFSPYRELYFVNIGLQMWAIGIEYEHLCTHSVSFEYPWIIQDHDKISINFDTRRLRK